jgi:hypothetical protein
MNDKWHQDRRSHFPCGAFWAEVKALKRLQAETAAGLVALLPTFLGRAFKGEL